MSAMDEERELASKSPLEQEISNALLALSHDPLAVDQFARLISLANNYVQAEPSITDDAAVPVQEARFKPHQLCRLCATDRTDEKGRTDERAFRFRLQMCMLRALSFKIRRRTAIWLEGLAKCIQECSACYQGFLTVKREIGQQFLHSFDKNNIDQFLDFTLQWEEGVMIDMLKRSNVLGAQDMPMLDGPQAYAALELAGILVSKGKSSDLYEALRQAREKLTTSALPETPSGLIALATDDDEGARIWAQQQTMVPAMSELVSTTTATVGLLVGRAIERGQWNGFAFALNMAPAAFTGSALPNTLLAHLSDRPAQTGSILLCLQKLLEVKGASVWSQEDLQYPLVVLSSIFDSPQFTACIADSANPAHLLTWISPFLSSLPISRSGAKVNAQSSEEERLAVPAQEEKAKVYEEAMKRTIYFFLERIQQGHVPLSCRSAAVMQCISVLADGVAPLERLNNTASTSLHADTTVKALNQVAALHSTALANLAFRGKLPNSNDFLDYDDEARSNARDFICTVYYLDCHSMSESMLTLSDKSMRHQRTYKRLMKDLQARSRKKQNADALADTTIDIDEEKAVQEIFTQAADDFDVHPIICSELWKDGYNACQPNRDVDIFLRPLSRLSPFVEPHINSYIVVAKDRHAALPSYSLYKERLKAALLNLSRRLRAMRGNLPMLLLDLSDVTASNQGASTTDLPALCYKSADGIISASLCAEQEVHKAAQNVIRAAFEDAETRSDCFRSLLQCNPGAALKGIHEFLERFVVAASMLIEANDAAKWMVRSFSDVLDILSSDTDGLLRAGTPFSLIDQVQRFSQLRPVLLAIWSLMCKSIAIIFKRTPSWSRVLPSAELTAWFRDVTLFATEAVSRVELMQQAAVLGMDGNDAAKQQREQYKEDVLFDLSWPLEEALSWFRMNNLEIVQETRDYFVKGLECFQHGTGLPDSVKDRMLAFIDSQSKVENDEDRMTLLSLPELADLRLLLDPRPPPIEITDSEGSEGEDTLPGVLQSRKEDVAKVKVPDHVQKADSEVQRASDTLRFSTPPIGKTSKSQPLERFRMKQQRLSFQNIDSQTAGKRPFVSKEVPLPPAPRFTAITGSSNRYQSATSRPAASTNGAAPSKPATKMAQLRQDFRATHTVWKPNNKAIRPGLGGRELPEPQAPEAKRTFTSAPRQLPAIPDRESDRKACDDAGGSSSSESVSSDEERKVGLADLAGSKGSPVKMRTKTRLIPAPARRAIMIEDHGALRAKREREEAERKRRLRETPNFGPLHQAILSWSYFAEGDTPPAMQKLNSVRSTYRNAEEYASLFEPMLLLECWAELQAAREQVNRRVNDHTAFSASITGRSHMDAFDLLSITMQPGRGANQVWFQDTDVIFIREVIASSDGQNMTAFLVPGASLEMGKLFSLTTLHREYEALKALRFYDMLPNILSAKAAYKEQHSDAEVSIVQQDYSVNRPQAEAILSANKSQEGFQLIQGPPGTGKTKTICSLVAHFIQSRKAPAAPIRAGQQSVYHGAAQSPNHSLAVKKKILLCAPSNAAVDEVAKRVQMGVRLANGKVAKPIVVRVGREDAMNVAVKAISLEGLVEQRLAVSSSSGSGKAPESMDPAQMQSEIRSLKDQRDNKRAELESARQSGTSAKVIDQLDAELRNIVSKRMDLMSRLDAAKDARQTVNRQYDADRKRIQQEVLMQADVVCSTLGGAGHAVLSALPFDFETVVIDEAAQAVELDTLIPLRYGCQRCILVGDPNQLPPTVISREAERLRYSQSLFVRLFDNPRNHTNLLSIQYRMHPQISRFPSYAFYEGKLEDGPSMESFTEKPWHRDELLQPLRFFDCRRSHEQSGRNGHSFINKAEAEMAAAIYERLRREAQRYDSRLTASLDGNVGVVTMYKDQVFELKRAFRALYGDGIEDAVDFNTVDGFQGQEKDVIILSCVRSKGIGFLNDFRRINVAITRAKSNLFIIANVDNLGRHDRDGFWKRFLQIARDGKNLLTVSSDTFRRPSMPASFQPKYAGSNGTRQAPHEGQAVIPTSRAIEEKSASADDHRLRETGEQRKEESPITSKRPAESFADAPDGSHVASKKARKDRFSRRNRSPPAEGSTQPSTATSHNSTGIGHAPVIPSGPRQSGWSQGRPPGPPPSRPQHPSSTVRPLSRNGHPTPPQGIRPPRPAGVPIAIPGQPPPVISSAVKNSYPNKSAQSRPRPTGAGRPARGDGPSDQAKASLFMPKSTTRRPR